MTKGINTRASGRIGQSAGAGKYPQRSWPLATTPPNVTEELKKRRWTTEGLVSRRKSDKHKIKVAQRLRKETSVTIDWIAKRLRMGTPNSLSTLLSKIKKSRN